MNSTHAATAILSSSDAINALLESHPGSFEFNFEQIEEIAQSGSLIFYQSNIDKGNYLDNFLVSFNWWLKVAHLVLDKMYGQFGFDEEPAFNAISGILALYPTAYHARFLVDAVGSDPTGLELVKRYWNFRELVCSLVRRHFPGVDVEELSKLI